MHATDSRIGLHLDSLRHALARLDRLLERALEAATPTYGPSVLKDRYRGLHVGKDDVARLLRLEPGAPRLGQILDPADASDPAGPWQLLAERFGLADFDLDLLLLAIAPELDLRYERVYAFLQDDITRRRPTVDLAFNLLCATADQRLFARTRLAPDAPLLANNLLELVPDPTQIRPPLLSHYLVLDEQIVRLLLCETTLDSRLPGCCELVTPLTRTDDPRLESTSFDGLAALVSDARSARYGLRLVFHGPAGSAKREAA